MTYLLGFSISSVTIFKLFLKRQHILNVTKYDGNEKCAVKFIHSPIIDKIKKIPIGTATVSSIAASAKILLVIRFDGN